MTENDRQTILIIKGAISELGVDQAESCHELAEFLRANIRNAGSPIGELALALVGAEMAAEQP